MPDNSAILALPYIQPSQAQKHVTHNAALGRLDVLVQLSVIDFDATTPPVTPVEGETYALGTSPTGDWAGEGDMLASWADGIWQFIAPLTGWRAWGQTPAELRVWDGTTWALPVSEINNLDGLGINTTYDTTNRLSVRSDATLLSHDGDDHQLKINKAASGDTASLLFQSAWTGHAEMGLSGSTDFTIKVSDDGSSWTEAMSFDGASGKVTGKAAAFTSLTGSGDMNIDTGTLFVDANVNTVGIGTLSNYSGTKVQISTGTTIGTHPTLTSLLTLEGNGSAQTMLFNGLNSSVQSLIFRDADTGATSLRGMLRYSHSIDEMALWASGGKRLSLDVTGATISGVLSVDDATNTTSMRVDSTHASLAAAIVTVDAARVATSAYSFLEMSANGGADLSFKFSGDANGTCDGSWTGGGADYAEYFEWADGNPDKQDRRGVSVVLIGDTIREAKPGEDPIGVISGNPSVVGDAAPFRWKGKHLCDDFGSPILEDYDVVEWSETVTNVGESGEDTTREVVHSYAVDEIPDGVKAPADATRTTQQRRQLSPGYDRAHKYIPRAERPEWDMVGLMGKLRLRKGQATGARWIKMRKVSKTVEEWLVR